MTTFLSFPLFVLRARRWVAFVIVPSLIITAFAYWWVGREPKIYQTSTTLYVQQPSDGSTLPGSTDVYTSEALIPTYARMLALPVVADEVNRKIDKIYPGYQVQAHNLSVSTTSVTSSTPNNLLFDVTTQDTIPARAALAADSAAQALIEKIVSIQRSRFKGGEQSLQTQMHDTEASIQFVSERINTFRGAPSGLNSLKAQLSAYQSIYATLLTSEEQFNVGRDTALKGIRVFSPAVVPGGPISPRPAHSALIALFVALLLTAGLLYLHDYFDDSIQTPEDVMEVTGARILGTVLRVDPSALRSQGHKQNKGHILGDAYRVIRTNLQTGPDDSLPRTLLVTSAAPSEGKSTTASNLARVLAAGGQRVTLVDADLRRPSIHKIFSVPREQGLVDLVKGDDEAAIIKPTEHNLQVITSGRTEIAPADVLNSARMRAVVPDLQANSDVVLLDSPPVLAVADAAILAMMVDGVVLVVDPSKSTRRDLQRARDAVEGVGGKIAGVVVNRLSRTSSPYYYYYYEYHYGYTYGGYDHEDDQAGTSSAPKHSKLTNRRARAMVKRIRRRSAA